MQTLLLSFFSSTLITFLIIRYKNLYGKFSNDNDFSAPQKFHQSITPRIGGFGIFLSLCIAYAYRNFLNYPDSIFFRNILISAVAAFGIGLLEDTTKKIGVKTRFLIIGISAIISIYFLNIRISNVDVYWINFLLSNFYISTIFTIFAITGLVNAYNIIDGFNGLSSMVAIGSLLAISYVSFIVHDTYLLNVALITISAILGFFIWNYPRGLIFLGDSGAYLIGFIIALLSILLVNRNSSVSPWFPLAINAYPIFETIFTIWRRRFFQGKNPGLPDAMHFHSLIYRRIARWAGDDKKVKLSYSNNSRTSPYLWVLSCLCITPGIVWWNNTNYLIGSSLIFSVIYVWLYKKLISFNIPWWLKKN